MLLSNVVVARGSWSVYSTHAGANNNDCDLAERAR
jgi:hypothetical protein